MLPADTSPSTDSTHISSTQVTQDVAETPQVQLRKGSVRGTLLQTSSFKRERDGEVELQAPGLGPQEKTGDHKEEEKSDGSKR